MHATCLNYLNVFEQAADKVVEHLHRHPSQPLSDRPLGADAAARGVVVVIALPVAGARRPQDEAVGLHRRDGRRGPRRGRCNGKWEVPQMTPVSSPRIWEDLAPGTGWQFNWLKFSLEKPLEFWLEFPLDSTEEKGPF